jgi:uncharacterized membrane-anchored protein YitT (DUF2179 family)
MNKESRYDIFKEKVNAWFYDHLTFKTVLVDFWIFVVCTISAALFGFGFNAFMDIAGDSKLVSGGLSGLSQNVTLIFEICGWRSIDEKLAESIMYFLFNVPLIILAWLRIGKKFTIFTLINVGEVSLFIWLMDPSKIAFIKSIADYVSNIANDTGGLLARALFAGICTGLSSALAFKVDISAGGVDIIAYYIALRKNTLTGKYSMVLNTITVTLFAILTSVNAYLLHDPATALNESANACAKIFYSILYVFVCMAIIDAINVRNKKLKIEVVTSRKDLADVLISTVPHGATILQGTGVYTGEPRYVIEMVVSSYEVNEVVKIVKKEDPSAFVEVTPLSMVVGRFHMPPVK